MRTVEGFAEEVRRLFHFLELEHGFRCVQTEVSHILYQSHSAFATVTMNPQTTEVDFRVGLLPGVAEHIALRWFDSYNILRSVGLSDLDMPYVQSRTREQMEEGLTDLAALLRRFAGPLLAADPAAYLSVREATIARSDEQTRERRARIHRRKEGAALWAEHPELFREPAAVRSAAQEAYARGNLPAALAEYEYLYEEMGQELEDGEFGRYYALRASVHEQQRRARRGALFANVALQPATPGSQIV